jgi:hypothetical protein
MLLGKQRFATLCHRDAAISFRSSAFSVPALCGLCEKHFERETLDSFRVEAPVWLRPRRAVLESLLELFSKAFHAERVGSIRGNPTRQVCAGCIARTIHRRFEPARASEGIALGKKLEESLARIARRIGRRFRIRRANSQCPKGPSPTCCN